MSGLPLLLALLSVPAPVVSMSDLERFPPQHVVKDALEFANAHIAWVEHQRKWAIDENEVAYYESWGVSAFECRRAWWLVQRPTNEAYLRELRDLIGPEAYAAGQLPCMVPLEYFEIRE